MSIENSSVSFGLSKDNLEYFGKIYMDYGDYWHIEIISNPKNEMANTEAPLFVKLDNFKEAMIFNYIKSGNRILFKKIYTGTFIENLEYLKVPKFYFRTTNLNSWFSEELFKNNTFLENNLQIEAGVLFENTEISFNRIYDLEQNFDNINIPIKSFIELKSKNEINLIEFEDLSIKILNLLKLLQPKKYITIEESYFDYCNKQVVLYSYDPFFRQKEIYTQADYIFLGKNQEKLNLIKKWLEIYDKFDLLFNMFNTIFNKEAIQLLEANFLLYAQWIEGFGREKYSISEENKKEFEEMVENVKDKLKGFPDYLQCIDEHTKYGLKINFLQLLKKLIQEIKDNCYIDVSSKHKKSILDKIVKLRNELTHLIPKRENYTQKEVFDLVNILKVFIIISTANELELKMSDLQKYGLPIIPKSEKWEINYKSILEV